MRLGPSGCLLSLFLAGCTSPQWAVHVVNDTESVVPFVGLQLQWDAAHPAISGACQDLAPGNSLTVKGAGGPMAPIRRLRVQWQAGAKEEEYIVAPRLGDKQEQVLPLSIWCDQPEAR